MHLVFLTRGIKHYVDHFINELSTRYLPVQYMKDGKKIDDALQLRVCPVQLWDISFPEEHKDAVMGTVFAQTQGVVVKQRGHLSKFIWLLRKGLKLDPIPEYEKGKILAMLQPKNIDILGIGVRPDKWREQDGTVTESHTRTDNAEEQI